MNPVAFTVLPPPTTLADDVEYFRIISHVGSQELAIRVCPNGHPGIIFQHHNRASAVRDITTASGQVAHVPMLFLYGQTTELGIMHIKAPSTTLQVVLKPYGLKTLLGLDAPAFTNRIRGAEGFGAEALLPQLLAAASDHERIRLLGDFLTAKRGLALARDTIVEESIYLIDQHIDTVTLPWLLGRVGLSERQFERRFAQAVGITPQYHIRLRRVNEAMRLMDVGQFERLGDVAHALGYHDQSHFIRDIKAFSGITPKSISQKVNDFHRDQVGSSYLYA